MISASSPHRIPNIKQKLSPQEIEQTIFKKLSENNNNRELNPPDQRIEKFLKNFFIDLPDNEQRVSWLPQQTFICDQYGISRTLSLPRNGDEFYGKYVESYRLYNGILHNPSTDKRTTKDVFHIVEGGLPIPTDKKAVSKNVFAKMLHIAFHPNDEILTLPYTFDSQDIKKTFVSSYFQPVICPNVDGIITEKRMEIRFFVPGSLVSILDCTESIFGNDGSPYDPENDLALNPDQWTGHTGCIIFAPQLRKYTKKELGLPHISNATKRQQHDGMCWSDEQELYHNGKPFKIIARDGNVLISIIGDSYNGYGKKEIKTQMSYAANMFGLCEEEHSGGALTFPSYDLGFKFCHKDFFKKHSFKKFLKIHEEHIHLYETGYAIDMKYPDIIYLPENSEFYLNELKICWKYKHQQHSMLFELNKTYVMPSGYRIELVKPTTNGDRWKMIGIRPDGTFCYKPATVSGGGKSEIAKPIVDNIIRYPIIISDYEKDMDIVDKIVKKDFSKRFKNESIKDDRTLLDKSRSVGSVVQLLTPSDKYTDEYNSWIGSISPIVREIVLAVKAYYRKECGNDWRTYFDTDIVNGRFGNCLSYSGSRLVGNYLRVGFNPDNKRRLFSLRDDFYPASKLQLADDITSTVILSSKNISGLQKIYKNYSVKFVHNCEYRLYQRPDEAIIPGYDHEAEYDMTLNNLFTCNFKPLTREDVIKMSKSSISFDSYTQPMKKLLNNFINDKNGAKYVVCPSELRKMPEGHKSTNQRYLQDRQDIKNERIIYLSKLCIKLYEDLQNDDDIKFAVNSILTGRRNNPPEIGVKPLCVYNPLHYMDLPELFMEYIASVTGKSPSTTGAGLEGAMTKGPFNSISTIYDLNSAMLGFILTGYNGFLSSAGCVGPNYKIEHDITYIIPEIWSRMHPSERDPNFLIKYGFLEKCNNMQYNNAEILFERMGYRITEKFVVNFAGRIFSDPEHFFTPGMLHPELQSMEIFANSMANIVDAHQRSANLLFEDNSIDEAIPPLYALLHIMKDGSYNNMTLDSKQFREMFKYKNVIRSDWYLKRLTNYQNFLSKHIENGEENIRKFIKKSSECNPEYCSVLNSRLNELQQKKLFIQSDKFIKTSYGTIGRCDKYL